MEESPFKAENYDSVMKIGKATIYGKQSDKKMDVQRVIQINREIAANKQQ